MATTTSKGLYVWDLNTDQFNHTELADNWNLIDGWLGKAQFVETLGTLPTTGNFAGRLVTLSAPDSGFPAWSTVRYNGSAWQNVGTVEILPALPTLSNYAGRIVVLSANDGIFQAWDVALYDGSAWRGASGLTGVNTGAGTTNIVGRQTDLDIYLTDATRGVVLTDRTGGIKRRLYFDNGVLTSEVVT